MLLQLVVLATCLACGYAAKGESCLENVNDIRCLNDINQGSGGWEEKDVNHLTGYGYVADYIMFQGRVSCRLVDGYTISKSELKRVYIRGDNAERDYCIKFKGIHNDDSGEPVSRVICVVEGTQTWQLGKSKIVYDVYCKDRDLDDDSDEF